MVEGEEKRTTVAKKQVKQFYFTHHYLLPFCRCSWCMWRRRSPASTQRMSGTWTPSALLLNISLRSGLEIYMINKEIQIKIKDHVVGRLTNGLLD